MTKINLIIAATALCFSCTNSEEKFDATGTFEAVEIIVSAEANGMIKELNASEGELLKKDQPIGYIDSTQLYLKKKQLYAQIKALTSRSPDVALQLASLEEQLKQARNEQARIERLHKENAATNKQLDDVKTQVAVLEKQLEANRSTLGISSKGISEETMPLTVQIEQINDQLFKSSIINPINGTVLLKYAEENEMTAIGKPLYKIADLSSVTLRAYVTGDQLSKIKTGQIIKIFADEGQDNYRSYQGSIEWISDKAEFTPKTIQTKDERANLVYAIKVKVKNDGSLKIGMYGEIKF